MSFPDELRPELRSALKSALDLDEDERTYLASLNLPGAWRARAQTAPASHWGWLALLVVVAGFIAWTLAADAFGQALDTANQVGLSTVVLTSAVGMLLGVGQALLEAAMQPALSLSQPLLAVLALVLLFWPRIASAPHPLQGAQS
jgi:hypothetical protein